jgi:DNA-binding LytR/AlgR family response regulator
LPETISINNQTVLSEPFLETPVDDVSETSAQAIIEETVIVMPTNETEPTAVLAENSLLSEAITDEKPTVSHADKPVIEEKPLIICVKSYGDYRFIEAKDICYLQADNNSTDIHLYNGEMITAFKTLKHFEGVLQSPFVRIHNSYIVNIDYVSRIHTGNAVCYIKNTTIKLPFSKSYKENVDSIINSITNGNYLEI